MAERQDRLEEIMAEMLIKQDTMIDELRGVNNKMEGMNKRLDKLEKQMILNNKGVGELRLGIMKLAERQKSNTDLDRRVRKVESVLVKNKLM